VLARDELELAGGTGAGAELEPDDRADAQLVVGTGGAELAGPVSVTV